MVPPGIPSDIQRKSILTAVLHLLHFLLSSIFNYDIVHYVIGDYYNVVNQSVIQSLIIVHEAYFLENNDNLKTLLL